MAGSVIVAIAFWPRGEIEAVQRDRSAPDTVLEEMEKAK